jgi:hypothetical protein
MSMTATKSRPRSVNRGCLSQSVESSRAPVAQVKRKERCHCLAM